MLCVFKDCITPAHTIWNGISVREDDGRPLGSSFCLICKWQRTSKNCTHNIIHSASSFYFPSIKRLCIVHNITASYSNHLYIYLGSDNQQQPTSIEMDSKVDTSPHQNSFFFLYIYRRDLLNIFLAFWGEPIAHRRSLFSILYWIMTSCVTWWERERETLLINPLSRPGKSR